MPNNDVTFKIGGEAGQGVESSAGGLARAIARGGLHVFELRDYYSRIRGGHNFAQIRVSSEPITSHNEEVHILLAMTQQAIKRHFTEVVDGGGILYADSLKVDDSLLEQVDRANVQRFPMPLLKFAEEIGGHAVMLNTAATAAAAGLTSYPLSYIKGIIQQNFKKKGQAIIDANLRVAEAAYAFAAREYGASFEHKLEPIPGAPQRMLINGNQAFSYGALAGGCRIAAGYPMSPATSVLEWLAAHALEYDLVLKHTEDEISAICMAIGAGHVGARAIVPTSGGGFSLMVEALGFAGISETPVVVYEVQRPGPATGLPTRHEQGDLLFAIWASQGEFPRIVLAPGTPEETFEAGYRALNLAEKYQTPVIVLSDQFLAASARTVDADTFDLGEIEIDRGKLLTNKELDALTEEYHRYAPSADGISQRALPGHPRAVYSAEGNEHSSDSGISEEIATRIEQQSKRMQKLETARNEIRQPQHFGPDNPPLTMIGWGSTVGPALEALKLLNAHEPVAEYWHVADIWPFPAEAMGQILSNAKLTVVVEQNSTGQLARLITQETGIKIENHLLKFDGRPFSPEQIAGWCEGGVR